MPYIDRWRRTALGPSHGMRIDDPVTPGELNYLITKLIVDYYRRGGGYSSINDILGALEGAKLEFYRRVATPYEDSKIQINGDVY